MAPDTATREGSMPPSSFEEEKRGELEPEGVDFDRLQRSHTEVMPEKSLRVCN